MRSAPTADRWTRQLAELDIPAPFDMDHLFAALADHRGRAIELVAMDFGSTQVSGLWVATDDADMIFFERDTTPLHQQHIQLHEIGHMLSDHPHATGPDDGWRSRLLPHLDVERIDALMARSDYDTEHEVDAERFAREMGARARQVPTPRGRSAPRRDSLARAFHVFGRPW